MSETPERIWIDKTYGQHPEDWDFTDGQHLTKAQLRKKVEYTRTDLVRAQIEAAVKRALKGAAEHLSMFAEPGVSLDYSLEDEIKAIRALDPAQFIEGDRDG